MSDEYIEKEDAIQSIIAHDIVGIDARGWAEYLLENTSTADVAPVRHAKWIDDDEEYLRHGYQFANCSVCGFQMDVHENRGYYNYCPLCGAKMDEEDTNE